MSIQVNIEDIQHAWDAKDPQLPLLIDRLSRQHDQQPTTARKDTPTFDAFLSVINSEMFRRQSREEKALYRMAQIKLLESDQADVPLSDRLRLHEIILTLWQEDSPFARSCLFDVIAGVNLTYGPWRALKRIYKEAEAQGDTQIMGALAARFDMAVSNQDHQVSHRTLGYLCRRAWRYLRRTAEGLPVFYAEAAADYLVWYTDQTRWNNTWIANHILFHEQGRYTRKTFWVDHRANLTRINKRAYAELWRRTPRPLFALLERARSERIREFAVQALKTDFKTTLRDIEPAWVARIIHINSATLHEFAVWMLENAPRLEQAAFHRLGLHEAVLSLFDSPAGSARVYAADYARTHARDLGLDHLIRLVHNTHEAVRKLAFDLLSAKHPRKDVGLAAWGKILETRYGHDYAAKILSRHFGPRDLTPAWFKTLLLSPNAKTVKFAKALLPQVHPFKKLGAAFFTGLLLDLVDVYPNDEERATHMAEFALDQLARFDLNALDEQFLKQMFVHPMAHLHMAAWFDEGRLKAKTLDIGFYKSLACFSDWQKDPWIQALKRKKDAWRAVIEFNAELAAWVRQWLSDVRKFSPDDIGFDWLIGLVGRSEPDYHQFAVDMLIKAFAPADFAPSTSKPEASSDAALAGCERLWAMATGKGKEDDPIRKFAVAYLRRRHPDICLAETDRPVDPGEEIPAAFLTYERIKPVFTDDRRLLRELALEYAQWEFARWNPSPEDLIALCEAPDPRIRQFVARALFADDTRQNSRFRLDANRFSAASVYAFCESADDGTRELGMLLIRSYPQFQVPEALFRLTESPDRRMRAFVIRIICSLYRQTGITSHWQPPTETSHKPATDADIEAPAESLRPVTPFAGHGELRDFLRRILFEIPPARYPKQEEAQTLSRLKPLSTRKAKLAMIDVMRDLAVEDEAFARVILPLLEEFMLSKGKSEMAACLVAVTRIKVSHQVAL